MSRIRLEKHDGFWMVSGYGPGGEFWVSPFFDWYTAWQWLFWDHPEVR